MTATPDSCPETTTFVVDDSQSGTRLDSLLAKLFPQYSRTRLRDLINATEAQVNAKHCKAAYRVRLGDVISIRFSAAKIDEGPVPEDIPLDVVYEDERIAVINKPHGMVVHPSKGHLSGTLTAALAHRFGKLSQAGGPSRPGIVHRLDRDTSGIIIVARDDQAHVALAKQFELRTVEKEYFAIVRGTLDRDRDWIEQSIGPHPYQREKMAIREDVAAARQASTFWEVSERFKGFASLRVFPKTGRTHQIRVHLAHMQCPVVCDPLYSGKRRLARGDVTNNPADVGAAMSRLALHARRLMICHPDDGRRLEFESPVPPDFESLLTLLREFR